MATIPSAPWCRGRAAYLNRWSATCASPSTRTRFIRIAKSWLALASELEQRNVPGASVHNSNTRKSGHLNKGAD